MEQIRCKIKDINNLKQILLVANDSPSRKFIIEIHWGKSFSLFSYFSSFRDPNGEKVHEPYKALRTEDYHFLIDPDDFTNNETYLIFNELYQYRSGIKQ